jgi:hypothetical protein
MIPGFECPYVTYLPSISVFLYMYIKNCVHIMFKICYMTIILSYYFLYAVHMMQSFVNEKMLWGNYNYSPDESFLTGNEEIPALILSNVHKRTSAPDCPSFCSIGLSMSGGYKVLLEISSIMADQYRPRILSPNAVGEGGELRGPNQ